MEWLVLSVPRKSNQMRKDGRIAVQVYLGREDGKRKYKTVYGKTQKEADEKANKLRLAMHKGIDVASENDTFGIWCNRWLDMKELEATKKQMDNYRCCLRQYELLWNIPVGKLRPADFQTVIIRVAKRNENTGKPASRRTLLDMKSAAYQVCQLAMDNRVIEYNPVSAVSVPSGKPAEERRALTQEEQKWIIDTPERGQRAAMIMLYAGLRRGELIPLLWDDVDLENGTITVNKTVYMDNGKSVVKNTAKTKKSIRVIDIPAILVGYLKAQQKDSQYVCASVDGKMLNDIGWRRMWNSYLLDLNLKYGDFSAYEHKPKSKFDPRGVPFVIPRFTAHWLRHTYATMLYHAGVDPMTAMEQLGHSDIKTTLGIYTHLDATFKRKNIDKLDAYLENASQHASQK